MIIVKLHGGLGNQMFQYALGRNLSLLHGVPFKIDSSYMEKENQSARTLRINGFKTLLDEATENESKAYRGTVQKILDHIRPDSKRKKILELPANFDSTVLERADGYFVGHWNDERYFKASETIIRKDFELKRPLGIFAQIIAERILLEPEPISVHIRRGDYVSIPKIADAHGTLPLSYYEQAMKIIFEKSNGAHFFISSDDIAWAKENFPKRYPVTFVSSPEITDYEELTLMSLCKHHIIANSTFSWWGAWLNQNPNKIVCAPLAWRKNISEAENPALPEWLKF